MGVPKFFVWLIKNDELKQILKVRGERMVIEYQRFTPEQLSELFSNVDSLYIDVNAWLHPFVQHFYKLGEDLETMSNIDRQNLERDKSSYSAFDLELKQQLSNLVRRFNARNLIYLGVDGLAPVGKMNQQKRRRYAKAKESMINGKLKPRLFDTNMITPGTNFMQSVDSTFISWMETASLNEGRDRNYGFTPPREIVYSGHNVIGEGEHKILDHIRRNPGQKGKTIIWGGDADLIFLCLMLPENPNSKVYIARENTKTITSKNEHTGKVEKITNYYYNLVDISVLGNALEGYFRQKEVSIETHSKEQLMHDFSFLMMMMGDDFLPKMPIFQLAVPADNNDNSNIDLVLSRYAKHASRKRRLTIFHEGAWRINWTDVSFFLSDLAGATDIDKKIVVHGSNEKSLLTDVAYKMDLDNSSPIKQSSLNNAAHEFDYRKFQELWYNTAIGFKGQGNFTDVMLKSINNREPLGLLAQKLVNTQVHVPDIRHFLPSGNTSIIRNMIIHDMCVKYLTTMNWVFYYYQFGLQAVDFYFSYPYLYAPLLINLGQYCASIFNNEIDIRQFDEVALQPSITKPNNGKYTLIHQLLSVLPPTSIITEARFSQAAMPHWAAAFSIIGSKIDDLFPDDFLIDYQWTTAKDNWMTLELLPPVEPYRIIDAIDEANINDENMKSYIIREMPINKIYRNERVGNLQDALFSTNQSGGGGGYYNQRGGGYSNQSGGRGGGYSNQSGGGGYSNQSGGRGGGGGYSKQSGGRGSGGGYSNQSGGGGYSNQSGGGGYPSQQNATAGSSYSTSSRGGHSSGFDRFYQTPVQTNQQDRGGRGGRGSRGGRGTRGKGKQQTNQSWQQPNQANQSWQQPNQPWQQPNQTNQPWQQNRPWP